MAYFTYDTSVFISRRLINIDEMPRRFLMSAVVMMELLAGIKDESQRKGYEQIYRQYQKNKSLIVPNEDDWLLASKILNRMTHVRRQKQGGKLKQLPPGASQRLALDVLIAVSAKRWNVQVVTENWADFKAIQRYCDTTIVKAAKFFKKYPFYRMR
jgi:predicted nucleic acid-binding protein